MPDALQTDFLHVMDLAPKLLEELVKLTLRPRAPMGTSDHRTRVRFLVR